MHADTPSQEHFLRALAKKFEGEKSAVFDNGELYPMYRSYCEDNHLTALASNAFGRALTQ